MENGIVNDVLLFDNTEKLLNQSDVAYALQSQV